MICVSWCLEDRRLRFGISWFGLNVLRRMTSFAEHSHYGSYSRKANPSVDKGRGSQLGLLKSLQSVLTWLNQLVLVCLFDSRKKMKSWWVLRVGELNCITRCEAVWLK